MSTRSTRIGLAIALGASAASLAQSPNNAAFSATGTSCSDVTWSQATLEQYPRIADACQGVVERDGKYYVKFSGDVRRVADRGRKLTIAFKGGDRIAVSPPENTTVYLNGKSVPVSDLRAGDALDFYVPQDRLALQFPEGEPFRVSVPISFARAEPEPAGLVPHATMAATSPQLPKTASELPALAVFGFLLTTLGAGLTVLRRLHRAS